MKVKVVLALLVSFYRVNRVVPHPDVIEFIAQYVQRQGFQHVHLIRPLDGIGESSKSPKPTSWTRLLLKSLRGTLNSSPVYYAFHNYCHETWNSSKTPRNPSSDCDQVPFAFLREGSSSSPLFVAYLLAFQDFEGLRKAFDEEEHRRSNWLIISSRKMISTILRLHLPLDNKVVFAVIIDNDDSKSIELDLWDVHKAASHFAPKKFYLGRWSANEWLPYTVGSHERFWEESLTSSEHNDRTEVVRLKNTKVKEQQRPLFSREPWKRRKDLLGLVVRCATKAEEPYVRIGNMNEDGIIEDIRGIFGEFFYVLKEALNFTHRCFKTADDTWGSFQDGKWSGLVGDLLEDRADLIVSNLDHTYAREQVIDFPYGLQHQSYQLVVKPARAVDNVSNNYTREFPWPVWMSVTIFGMIMCLCLLIVLRHSPYNEKRPLTEVIWLMVAAFFNAGGTVSTSSISSRILLLALYLMIMIIHAHYNSFLISSLTVEEDYVPFTDIRGMYEARTHSFGVAQGSASEDNLKLSQVPLFKSIWNEMVMADPRNLHPDGNYHMKRMCAENYVSFTSQSYVRTRVFRCKILVLPGNYFTTQTSMPLQKDSRLLSTFRFQMRRLAEFGILDRLNKKYAINKESSDVDITPISALQTSTAFFFLIISYLTALVILAVEMIYANWQRKQNYMQQ